MIIINNILSKIWTLHDFNILNIDDEISWWLCEFGCPTCEKGVEIQRFGVKTYYKFKIK